VDVPASSQRQLPNRSHKGVNAWRHAVSAVHKACITDFCDENPFSLLSTTSDSDDVLFRSMMLKRLLSQNGKRLDKQKCGI
jgi:hypothetical protein